MFGASTVVARCALWPFFCMSMDCAASKGAKIAPWESGRKEAVLVGEWFGWGLLHTRPRSSRLVCNAGLFAYPACLMACCKAHDRIVETCSRRAKWTVGVPLLTLLCVLYHAGL